MLLLTARYPIRGRSRQGRQGQPRLRGAVGFCFELGEKLQRLEDWSHLPGTGRGFTLTPCILGTSSSLRGVSWPLLALRSYR